MKRIIAFALLLIGVTAVAAIAADSKSSAGDGRYQIVNTVISMPGPVKYDLSQPVLIDNQSGSTWILAQPEGQTIGWYPLKKSDVMPESPKAAAPKGDLPPSQPTAPTNK